MTSTTPARGTTPCPSRIRTWSSAIGILVTGLTLPLAGGAQERPTPPSGSWSLTFALPSGGGGSTLGAWRMISRTMNAGFEVDVDYRRIEDDVSATQLGSDVRQRRYAVTLGPTIKQYVRVRDPIGAYIRASVGIGWGNSRLERLQARQPVEQDTSERSFIARVAVGADWFPVDGLSIGGFTGVFVSRTYQVARATVGTLQRTTWAGSTFRSGLELQYYF